mmetsp:Transcript_21458/g.50653  ORF Transcript_21458/g.50653 Transcript_21458/m.50653 type:complete len:88 (-) Transcript_21458:1672-1935(-)
MVLFQLPLPIPSTAQANTKEKVLRALTSRSAQRFVLPVEANNPTSLVSREGCSAKQRRGKRIALNPTALVVAATQQQIPVNAGLYRI